MVPLVKLKAILLYFANDSDKLGKVKLMKLIYFMDFTHVKKYGTPITYDNYVHIKHGPIPSTIKNLVDYVGEDLNSQLADTISIEKVPTRRNTMAKIVAKRKFTEHDRRLFSETELEVLKEVADRFRSSTSDEIEEASHKEAPWKETSDLESISYSLAARDKDSRLSEEEIKLLLKT